MPPRKKKAASKAEQPAATIPRENALATLEESPKAAEDFYRKLRRRMRTWLAGPQGKHARWADYLMFAPDLFHLIVRLALDPEVTLANRLRLSAAAAYFMSPIDFIPELLAGPVGFLDDIALAAYVLHRLINTSDRAIVQRHWAGDANLLTLVQDILAHTNAMLGDLVARRIQRLAKWVPRTAPRS